MTQEALKSLDKVTIVPIVLGFSTLWLGTTIIIIVSIINGSCFRSWIYDVCDSFDNRWILHVLRRYFHELII